MSTEEAITTLIKSYKSSANYKQVRRQVAEICKQDFRALEQERTRASFLTQSLILTRRSSINMFRDHGYYLLRFGIYVSLAISLATVFPDLGFSYKSIQDRGSLIMFIATFLTFMTIGGFPSFVEDMKGMFKNEFEGLTFPANPKVGHLEGSPTIGGEEILRNIWQVDLSYSKWVDLAILLGMVILYRLLFLGIIKTTEKVKPMITAFVSVPPNQTTQVMENPITTPLH
ncbi:hypothetical protein GH714_007737 [Hevea brasiliensis]|uniref:ABC-2 type transporter transmembrane domain-containing protein n=1 Tax=Hevea brasiliensis TaxID=3981 RepID=A0A6A6KYK2_HEVBR|nr:hypothetical protein GH714_007737 [Hevea brasiliensis]